ncbi:hypothetical protein HRD49_25550 [Corallococcus exiguus]|uniref:hypothetical protein n=1 Tax=Corallococcus TaxID=83461 RepID=UPI0013159904|nr:MULTISPECIES: hypothetical protein [Corallococcus]NNC20550.1 hypothetical protein [Corallococcus exiguus]NRD65126.1 hypothetical protein [Corallococcus exiguus]
MIVSPRPGFFRGQALFFDGQSPWMTDMKWDRYDGLMRMMTKRPWLGWATGLLLGLPSR